MHYSSGDNRSAVRSSAVRTLPIVPVARGYPIERSTANLQNAQSAKRVSLTGRARQVGTIHTLVGGTKNCKAPLLKFQHQFSVGCFDELVPPETAFAVRITVKPMSVPLERPEPVTEVER